MLYRRKGILICKEKNKKQDYEKKMENVLMSDHLIRP